MPPNFFLTLALAMVLLVLPGGHTLGGRLSQYGLFLILKVGLNKPSIPLLGILNQSSPALFSLYYPHLLSIYSLKSKFALRPCFCLSQATEDTHLTTSNFTPPSQATEYTGLTISTTTDLPEQITCIHSRGHLPGDTVFVPSQLFHFTGQRTKPPNDSQK